MYIPINIYIWYIAIVFCIVQMIFLSQRTHTPHTCTHGFFRGFSETSVESILQTTSTLPIQRNLVLHPPAQFVFLSATRTYVHTNIQTLYYKNELLFWSHSWATWIRQTKHHQPFPSACPPTFFCPFRPPLLQPYIATSCSIVFRCLPTNR